MFSASEAATSALHLRRRLHAGFGNVCACVLRGTARLQWDGRYHAETRARYRVHDASGLAHCVQSASTDCRQTTDKQRKLCLLAFRKEKLVVNPSFPMALVQ